MLVEFVETELGDMTFGALKLGEVGEITFVKLKLGELTIIIHTKVEDVIFNWILEYELGKWVEFWTMLGEFWDIFRILKMSWVS